MAAVVTSPLVVPIAEALATSEMVGFGHDIDPADFMPDALYAADAVIAVVAALPADYTAVDVLAFLRGDDVPSEPLPAKADRGGDPIPLVRPADVFASAPWVNAIVRTLNEIHAATAGASA